MLRFMMLRYDTKQAALLEAEASKQESMALLPVDKPLLTYSRDGT